MASSNNLKQKRVSLRSQRRQKVWQSIARFTCIAALAALLCWAISLPYWSIAGPAQIEVRGNRLLSADLIRSHLKLSYPESLWRLSGSRLVSKLETLPPIAAVEVSRQLLPPKLVVTIVERQPRALVAIQRGQAYLDETGVVIPASYYSRPVSLSRLPPLKVTGYTAQYQSSWQKLYSLIDNFPLIISAVDWHDPSNLVLHTGIGKVYLGDGNNLLLKKLNTLAKIAQLPGKVPIKDIVYIDLRNPDSPSISVKPETKKKDKKQII